MCDFLKSKVDQNLYTLNLNSKASDVCGCAVLALEIIRTTQNAELRRKAERQKGRKAERPSIFGVVE